MKKQKKPTPELAWYLFQKCIVVFQLTLGNLRAEKKKISNIWQFIWKKY